MTTATGGRRCTVCSRPQAEVHEINRQLVLGGRVGEVARKYGIHRDAVARHYATHVTPEIAAALKRKAAEEKAGAEKAAKEQSADEIVDDLTLAKKVLREVMGRALKQNRLDSVTRAVVAFLNAWEKEARLEGRLAEPSTTLVVIDSAALRSKIDERLARLAPPSRTIEHDR